MSHIAAALAKSKGKPVTGPSPGSQPTPLVEMLPPPPAPVMTAPPMVVGASDAATEAKGKPAWLVPGIIVALVLLAGGAGWFMLRPAPEAPAVKPTPGPLPAASSGTVSDAPAPARPTVGTSAPGPTAKAAEGDKPPAQAAVTAPEALSLGDEVRRLVITARTSGSNPGAAIGGKVYRPGDQVTDQLTLEAVDAASITFRGADGQSYVRRF